MIRFIFKRILMMIPVMLGVITIVFVLMEITPGDPVEIMVGTNASEEAKAEMRAELGLDQPIHIRYINYIKDLVTEGNIGVSYRSKQPVWNELMARFPNTVKLAVMSLIVSVVIGIPLGIASAVKQYSWLDYISSGGSLVMVSVPQFWMGLMLILLFAVHLKWLPSFGVRTPLGWVLPVATLGLGSAAGIARISRSSMLDVVRQDYMRTAKAKGQKHMTVIFKHGLKNAMIPIVTSVGSSLGAMLGGAVTIEIVFSISGVGKYILDGLSSRDYPVVQGGVLFLSLVFSLVNLLVDITYAYIDPRIKAKYTAKSISRAKRKQLKAQLQLERS